MAAAHPHALPLPVLPAPQPVIHKALSNVQNSGFEGFTVEFPWSEPQGASIYICWARRALLSMVAAWWAYARAVAQLATAPPRGLRLLQPC